MTKNFGLTDVCPSCARKLESAIKNIDGVEDARVSIMTEKLSLDFDDSRIDIILKEVKKACKKIEPDCILSID